MLSTYGIKVLGAEAGWSAVVRLPRIGIGAEEIINQGVVVHPGSFYGMPEKERIVLSLIVPKENFSTGICIIANSCS